MVAAGPLLCAEYPLAPLAQFQTTDNVFQIIRLKELGFYRDMRKMSSALLALIAHPCGGLQREVQIDNSIKLENPTNSRVRILACRDTLMFGREPSAWRRKNQT